MIKSVEKALCILDFVAEKKGVPVPLNEISRSLDMHVATCSHLVETLCTMQYLEKVSRNSGVIIGPAAYAISTPYIYRQDLLRIAVPKMKELCAEIQENVVISTYSNGSMYVPYSIYYRNGRITSKATVKGQLLDSATGPLILAYLNQSERVETIHNLPPEDETRKRYINQQGAYDLMFRHIRKAGVHTIAEAGSKYGAAACPIFGKIGLVAALGVNMPIARFTGTHLEETVLKTKRTATEISRLLREK